eukprot:365148-Chlamydomonas_euryale.AAC.10
MIIGLAVLDQAKPMHTLTAGQQAVALHDLCNWSRSAFVLNESVSAGSPSLVKIMSRHLYLRVSLYFLAGRNPASPARTSYW